MVGLRSVSFTVALFLLAAMMPIAMAQGASSTVTIGGGTVSFLRSLQTTLQEIGPILSAILFVVAGIIYAFGQLQPAEGRGRYQSWAMGLVVGGFVVGALSFAAPALAGIAGGLLT